MAYSNWGAFVFKNGERRKDREDVAVFNDDEKDCPSGLRIFANILKNQEKYGEAGNEPIWEHSQHAVLGDGVVRFCGCKCTPCLYVFEIGKVREIKIPEIENWERDFGIMIERELEIDSRMWKWKFEEFGEDENMIRLWLEEPDGSKWTGTCGYQYGAGFMD